MRAVRRAVQPVAGWPRQVQILALYDKLHLVDAHKVGAYVAGLQQADGSFEGDEWGEVDTRFTYCALSCLSILHCTVCSRPLQLPSRGPSMVKDAPKQRGVFCENVSCCCTTLHVHRLTAPTTGCIVCFDRGAA